MRAATTAVLVATAAVVFAGCAAGPPAPPAVDPSAAAGGPGDAGARASSEKDEGGAPTPAERLPRDRPAPIERLRSDLPAPAREPAAEAAPPLRPPCRAALPPEAPVPGVLDESVQVRATFAREVDAEPKKVVRAIALAGVLGERVRFLDVVNVTEERTETCLLSRRIDLDRETVLAALALDTASRVPAPGEERVVARFEAITTQNVTLDHDAVLGALAMGPDADLGLDDMADVERRTEVVRVVQHEVDTEEGQALLAVALNGRE